MLLKLGLIGELLYFVLKLGHRERQKVRSKEIVGPVSGAEGTPYCPSGLGVWLKVATMWPSLYGFFLVVILSFPIVPCCLLDLCLQDLLQRWELNSTQPNCPELHATFLGFLRGRLFLAASILSFPTELAPPRLLHLRPSHGLTAACCVSPRNTRHFSTPSRL